MGLAHSPRIVTDGLMMCLDASNRKSLDVGFLSWIDLIGSYDAGQVGTPSTVVSVNPSYIQDFTDSNYYQISNLAAPGTNNFTFSFWIYFTNVSSSSTLLTIDAGGTYKFIIRANFSSTVIYLNGPTNEFALTFSSGFTVNNWYNIVITKQSNVLTGYINSIQSTNTGTITDSITGSSPVYTLGKLIVASSQYLLGRFGSFQYYNRALSGSEVLQNFNALRGRFGI